MPARRRRPALAALVALAAVLGALAVPVAPAGADAPATQPPQASIVVDADTGAVIAGTAEHEALLTASTIKVLTALVALEHRSIDDTIGVSRLAASQPASRIDMKEGSRWPVRQAIDSLLLVSANDAAYALAEDVGGDLAGFATLATETGTRLGLVDTTFADPAGLDGDEGFQGGTRSSPYDLAIVARNALAVPAVAETVAKTSEEFTDPEGAGRRLTSHNKGFLTSYPGAIGMKTGFTSAAGRTLIAAARRDGRTCLSVVMGTWDDTGWAGHLLDQCFAADAAPAGAETLPPVRIATVDARRDALAAVPAALGARAAGAPAPAADAGTAAPAPPTTAAPAAPERTEAAGAPLSAEPAVAATPDAGGGWDLARIARTAGIVLLALLVVLVLLRRRAVKRQRARRRARMRAHQEARRRGMIDVVDPPDDSEMRLMPTRTSHHVSAGRHRSADRRVVRPTRPRRSDGAPRR